MLRVVREIYCFVKWSFTGINPYQEARVRALEMAGKGVSTLVKKLFMSSASSTIGTGTVLGIHGAMAPEEARFQDSTLNEAKIDDSRNMFKVDKDGSTGYFAIALFILLCLIAMGAISVCCGCSPSRMAKRRQEEEWKEEIRGMMMKKNLAEAELGLEAEGWNEVNNGPGTKGITGPRLVDGA